MSGYHPMPSPCPPTAPDGLDWFDGANPTSVPPPFLAGQHDAEAAREWARARRRSFFARQRRRAHRMIVWAIYNRECDIGWRERSLSEWTLR